MIVLDDAKITPLQKRLLKESQLTMSCSVCEKRVAMREEFWIDENGKAVHTGCHAQRILQYDSRLSGYRFSNRPADSLRGVLLRTILMMFRF
jgi:hypothetical protein